MLICKIIGSAFVIGAMSYLGVSLNDTLDSRYYQLRQLYSIFLQLKSEMRYLNEILPDCFCSIGDSSKEPFATWLTSLGEELKQCNNVCFEAIWKDKLDLLYRQSALSLDDIHTLGELSDKLSKSDGQTIEKNIDYILLELQKNRNELEAEMKQKKKIMTTLAMFFGLVTVIILL